MSSTKTKKAKPGRKPTGITKERSQITLDIRVKAKAQKLAKRRNVSLSSMIEGLLQAELDRAPGRPAKRG